MTPDYTWRPLVTHRPTICLCFIEAGAAGLARLARSSADVCAIETCVRNDRNQRVTLPWPLGEPHESAYRLSRGCVQGLRATAEIRQSERIIFGSLSGSVYTPKITVSANDTGGLGLILQRYTNNDFQIPGCGRILCGNLQPVESLAAKLLALFDD